jgi:hypothetical protein
MVELTDLSVQAAGSLIRNHAVIPAGLQLWRRAGISVHRDQPARAQASFSRADGNSRAVLHAQNLFVDHSQIVQLEALRSGIWGTKGLWGRVLTYKQDE